MLLCATDVPLKHTLGCEFGLSSLKSDSKKKKPWKTTTFGNKNIKKRPKLVAIKMLHTILYLIVKYISVLPGHPSCHLEQVKNKLWMGKNCYSYSEVVCFTCPNILSMDFQTDAMKSLGRTLEYMTMFIKTDQGLVMLYRFEDLGQH